jgi:hypothetical protein
MKCEYQCNEVGGPWIAENPNCPFHGYDAQREEKQRDRIKEQLYQQISQAQTLEEMKPVLYEIVEMI